jgi:hypothetical protein
VRDNRDIRLHGEGLAQGVGEPRARPSIASSREGIGVFLRTGRKLASINKGFLDYQGVSCLSGCFSKPQPVV